MTEKKIIFTGVTVDNSSTDNSIKLSISKVEFENQSEKTEIEKINFVGFPTNDKSIGKKGELETIFKKGSFVLTFDTAKVKINLIKNDSKSVNSATSSSNNAARDTNSDPIITVDEKKKTLIIQSKLDVIKITEQKTDDGKDKKTIINECIQEIKDKLQTAGISSDKEAEVLESNWETNYRAKWDKLDEAQIKNKKQEAITAIDSFSKKTPCRRKYDSLQRRMNNNGIKEADLSGEEATIYQKLKKGEYTEETEINTGWGKVNKFVCGKEAEKKFSDLTTRINKSIEDKNDEEMKKLNSELDEFIANSDYQKKKADAEVLSKKLKAKLSKSNTENGNNNKTPWKIIIPVIFGIIVIIAGLIFYFNSKNTEND